MPSGSPGRILLLMGAIVQSSDDTMELRRDINGKKVTLRCINSTDAEFIVAIRSDPDLNELSTGAISIDIHRKWYEEYLEKENDVYWVVLNQITGEKIGTTALYNIDLNSNKAESGRTILLRQYRDLALDTLYAVFVYAFYEIGLNKIYAKVREDEKSILRFDQKIGFSVEGLLRQDYWNGKKFISMYLISMLKDEFLDKKILYENYFSMLESFEG